MSEEKVDKRRIVSKERLLAMERMHQAKAAKAAERKNNVEVEPKPEKPEQKVVEEEVVSEDEVPVPAKKVKSQKPRNVFFSNDMEDDIRRYVEAALPPEFSKENRKKQKWEMRKKEIRDEILQSLKPSDTTPQPSKEPTKNEKNATLDISDLFF